MRRDLKRRIAALEQRRRDDDQWPTQIRFVGVDRDGQEVNSFILKLPPLKNGRTAGGGAVRRG